jgi:hypothetical protein
MTKHRQDGPGQAGWDISSGCYAPRTTMTGLMSRPRSAAPPIAFAFLAATAGANAAPIANIPLFTIAKSENKNQVEYDVRVDDRCAPLGPAPVSAYWRMLESGPTRTEPILPREQPAYGLASQTVVASGDSGGNARLVLRALPKRPIDIVTVRGRDGTCRALAELPIAGTPAYLFNVYVHLRWDGVDYLLLQAWSMDGSQVVREKITR